MFKELSDQVVPFLKESGLSKHVKKVWTYKGQSLVVDFVYRRVNFNFDLTPSGRGFVSIDVIQRKALSGLYLTPSGNRKTRLATDVGSDMAMRLLHDCAMRTISRIDGYLGLKKGSRRRSATGSTTAATPGRPMKIGVMTLPLNKNFGGNLQAFAMMETLRKLGHSPILLNRQHPPQTEEAKTAAEAEMSASQLLPGTYGMKDSIPNSHFIDKHISPTTSRFYSSSQLSQQIGDYELDALIVGSDQVWRAKYARTILTDFFFGFLSEDDRRMRRISYAASFGADKLDYKERLPEASRLLKKFDAVSVREDSAVALCRDSLGVEAQHVLDPTLLLGPADYERLFSDKVLGDSTGSLLAYVLDADPDKTAVISEISHRLAIDAYGTNGLPFGTVSALKADDGDRSIERWLASFHSASFVITDSFHGVAFSILFNKPFIAYGNPKRGMARFISLLRMFGLEDRLAVRPSDVDVDKMLVPIDWGRVNSRLTELRSRSLGFLESALAIQKPDDRIDAVRAGAAATVVHARTQEKPLVANPLKVLCSGCGVCVSESRGTLRMSWTEDGFLLPEAISTAVEPDAVKVCPFNTAPDKEVEDEDALANIFLPSTTGFDPGAGRFNGSYVGYSRQYRETSSSGGIATYVFDKLMKRGVVDYLFIVQSDGADGYRYCVCRDISDFRTVSKTRYYPVSMDELFDIVDRTPGRVAVSGVACFIKAIRLKQYYRPEYREKIPFLVGIICGGLKSKNYTDFLARSAKITGPYTKPEYRVKDAESTSSDYSFSAVDSESKVHAIKMHKVGNNWGAGLFKARACDFCSDVLTELADISLGDAWLPKYKADGLGNSVVLTRTPLADDIIRAGIAAGELAMEEVPVGMVVDSQAGGFNHKRKGLKFRVWIARYFNETPLPRLRPRVLTDIPISEAIVQVHRERTRSKSIAYWAKGISVDVFRRRMRSSRLALKVATAARKDGSNADLIAALQDHRSDFSGVSGANRLRRGAMFRLLKLKVGGDRFNLGMMRAALFGTSPLPTRKEVD